MNNQDIHLRAITDQADKAIDKTNRKLDELERPRRPRVEVTTGAQTALDRQLQQLEKRAAFAGKSGAERLMAERDLFLKRVGGDAEAINRTNAAYGQMIAAAQKAKEVSSSTADTIQSKFSAAQAAVAGLATGLAAGLARNMLKTAVDFQQARISIEAFLKDSQEAQKFFLWLQQFAQTSPLTFESLLVGAKRFMALKFSADETREALRAVSFAAGAIGLNEDKVNDLIFAIGQVKIGSKLAGQEVLQLKNAGINALGYLAEAYGKTASEMRTMMEKGLIPGAYAAEVIIKGVIKEFGGFDAAIQKSATVALSNLKDAWQQFSDAALRNVLPALTEQLKDFTTTLQMSGRLIRENWDALAMMGKSLAVVGIALATYKIADGIVKIATGLQLAAIAQRLFNAAAAANPYVLVATAVASLVGYLYLFRKESSQAERELSRNREQLAQTRQALEEQKKHLLDGTSATKDFEGALKGLNEQLAQLALREKALDIDAKLIGRTKELRDLENSDVLKRPTSIDAQTTLTSYRKHNDPSTTMGQLQARVRAEIAARKEEIAALQRQKSEIEGAFKKGASSTEYPPPQFNQAESDAEARAKRISSLELQTARDLAEAQGIGLSKYERIMAAADARIQQLREENTLNQKIKSNILAKAEIEARAAEAQIRFRKRGELNDQFLAIVEQADAVEQAQRRINQESATETQKLADANRETQLKAEMDALQRSRDARMAAAADTSRASLQEKVAAEGKKFEIEADYLKRSLELQIQSINARAQADIFAAQASGAARELIEQRVAVIRSGQQEAVATLRKSTDDSIALARVESERRQGEIVYDAWKSQYDRLRDSAGRVFDALITQTGNFADNVKRMLSTALLTPIKEFMSSWTAALFMGNRAPATAGAGRGGIGSIFGTVGGFGLPTFGGGPRMSGGIPTVGGYPMVGMNENWGGQAGGGFGLPGFGGLGMLRSLGNIGMKQPNQLDMLNPFFNARGVGGLAGGAMLLGGAGLMATGLYKGGWSGLGMSTAGGALIGAKFGGPIGAAIGAGVGLAAGFIRMLFQGRDQKIIDEVKSIYGISIDKTFAKVLAEQSKGQDMRTFLRSPQIREQIMLYGEMTGQRGSGVTDAAARGVFLSQSGGSVSQVGGYSGSSLYGYQSSLPSASGMQIYSKPAAGAQPVINVTIQADGAATTALMQGATVEFVNGNPRIIQGAAQAAQRQSFGLTEQRINVLNPLAI